MFACCTCRKRDREYEANGGIASGSTEERSGEEGGEGVQRPLKRQRLMTAVHAWPAGSTMSADPASATQPASGTLPGNPICKAHSGCMLHQPHFKSGVKQLLIPRQPVYERHKQFVWAYTILHEVTCSCMASCAL